MGATVSDFLDTPLAKGGTEPVAAGRHSRIAAPHGPGRSDYAATGAAMKADLIIVRFVVVSGTAGMAVRLGASDIDARLHYAMIQSCRGSPS